VIQITLFLLLDDSILPAKEALEHSLFYLIKLENII